MPRFFLAMAVLSTAAPSVCAQETVSYAKQVRPFLAKYCLECHNAKEAKAGLNLESVKAMHDGGDGGPVLQAGKPDASRLVLLVEGKDKPVMPPAKAKFRPKADELGVLRAWIAAGAKDDSELIKVVIPDLKPRRHLDAAVAALAYDPKGTTVSGGKGSLLFGRTLLHRDHEPTVTTSMDVATWPERQDWWPGAEALRITALGYRGRDEVVAVGVPGVWGDVVLIPNKQRRRLHNDLILDLAISSQGLLATGSYDTRIALYDPKADTSRTLTEHSDAVYGVAFSPDGQRLASCSADRAVKVWDVPTGKLLYTLGEANDWLYTVAWSPDGKYLAAGGVDKSIRVYAPETQGAKLLHSVFAHQEPVQKIQFSPDAQTLYSLGQGGTLKAWDVARMVERRVYQQQPDTVLCLALRPDGKQLALGRYDGAVLLLDPATGQQRALIPTPPLQPPIQQKPPAPQVKQLSPSAVVRGQRVALKVDGQGLHQLTGIETTIPGATVGWLAGSADSRGLELTIPAATALGAYELKFKPATGAALTAPLLVDAYPAISAQAAGGSPTTGQPLTLPTTVAGSIARAGAVEFFQFAAKPGQQLGIQIVTTAIGSKLEPTLQLVDRAGRVLAESNRGHLGFTFAEAGTYAVGVRDRELRGGANMAYRLQMGAIPVVTSFFPLGVQRGTETDVRLQGVFLGTDRVRVKAPATAALGSVLAVPVSTPVGAPLGSPQLTVGEYPESDGPTLAVPGTGNGVVAAPGAASTWKFHAQQGQRLIVEVAARRLGSELDSFIELLDKDGQPLPRAVLRSVAKTFVTFRDHDSVGAGIRLDAWSDLATNDYVYAGSELLKIQDLPPNADSDCVFFNTAGRRLGFLDTTPTHHAQGTPLYKVNLHPPGTTFPPNGLPVFTLYYRNDDGGPGLGRDSRLFFDPPATGDYQVRVRDARGLGGPGFAYRLTVRPPRPSFSLRFNPTTPALFKGSAAPVTITAERHDGFDGPIALRFENLPAGLSAPSTTIEAGLYSTTVAMFAEPNAVLPAKPLPVKLIGTALIDGKPQVQEVQGGTPQLLEPGELVTVTDEAELTLKPGQQTKLTVHIERRNGFVGRVPVDVRGLPHGVHALDIGLNGILINDNETQRTIVIYAEPWVQPAVHPFVVVARREGKNSEHAAKSVLLKLVK